MNYPLISEYIEAIKAAEDNFEELNNLRPVLGDDGQPVMTSGNFAVVFKMEDIEKGKFFALKCFTKEQEGRAEAYHQIADALKDVDSPYLVSLRYLEKELFVDTEQTTETEFPVLLMDWVKGKTLDKYLRENLDDKYALEMLAYRFSQLAQWLIPQPFAHGDLKPDNILVCEDGMLVLVDYDGMFVPSMKGQKARELGSPDFRHPLRTENDFDEHIDDFPLVSILLSLKTISLQPDFFEKYGTSERLLLSEKDYRNISKCGLLKELFPSSDSELNILVDLFILSLEKSNLADVSFRLLNLSKPQAQEPMILSTEVTEEDLANAWTDEFGVKYSSDKKKLLQAPTELVDYSIRKGTIVICDGAFYRKSLTSIYIPDGVTNIGNHAFSGCKSLTSIYLPDNIITIGKCVFTLCVSLTSISLPDSILKIGDSAFAFCISLKHIHIPYGITGIGDDTFYYCKSLISIHISDNVLSIGKSAFEYCETLTTITIPIGTSRKFEYLLPDYKDKLVEQEMSHKFCTKITDEELANAWIDEFGVKYSADKKKLLKCPIGENKKGRFVWKRGVLNGSYKIKQGTTIICDKAFLNCSELSSIYLPNSVKKIGNSSFWGCSSLKTLKLNDGLMEIGNEAFKQCKSLSHLLIPESLVSIGNNLLEESGIQYISTFKGDKMRVQSLLPDYKEIIEELPY